MIAPSQWHGVGIPLDGLISYLLLFGREAILGDCLGLGVLIFLHGMTIARRIDRASERAVDRRGL